MATGFQIKNQPSIEAAMINFAKGNTSKVTDFAIGSVIRTLFGAAAAELDEFYQQQFNGIIAAIPVSVYNSFSFSALPAVAASGTVTFYAPAGGNASATVIPAGTSVSTPSGAVQYATSTTATLAAGAASIELTVTATTAGYIGNTPAGTITALNGTISGIASVSNALDFTNGRDAESDADRKTRFQGYISTLARGTNAAVAYGAKTAALYNASGQITEQVTDAIVDSPYLTDNTQPISQIYCYIYNGSTGASASLVSQAQQIIDGYIDTSGNPVSGYKAAGVICTVRAVTTVAVNVTATLAYETGADPATVAANAISAVKSYLETLPIGSSAIYAEIIALIMDTAGVYNVTMSAPTADVGAGGLSNKLIPGTIAIS